MSFAGKVVIVTGASSGIGAKTAEFFCREGASVALVARNEAKLKGVSEKCASAGGSHIIIKADVSNDDDAKRIVNDTVSKFGKLDVLVNNAAVASYGNILDANFMELYDKMANINLRAVLQLTSLAGHHLVKTKGSVVNVSSVAALKPSSQFSLSSYSVLKAAMTHFTRCAAAELAASGVRVNTVTPGPVYTDLLENSGAGFTFDQVKGSNLLNRVSDPEEIADLILYLVGDKAVGITGSDFVTDNGFLLK